MLKCVYDFALFRVNFFRDEQFYKIWQQSFNLKNQPPDINSAGLNGDDLPAAIHSLNIIHTRCGSVWQRVGQRSLYEEHCVQVGSARWLVLRQCLEDGDVEEMAKFNNKEQ